MIKRICPICDKVMKGKYYCSFCRTWVKEPNVTKVDYYLNERRPTGVANLEYHNEFMHPVSAGTKKPVLENPPKPLDPMLEISQHMQSAAQKFGASMNTNKNVQKEKSTAGWIGMGIFILFSLITSCT